LIETCKRSAPTDNKIGSASTHRADHRVDRTMRCLNNHRCFNALVAQSRQHTHAITPGHDQIEYDRSDVLPVRTAQDIQGFVASFSRPHLVTEAANHGIEEAALDGIIVHDKDGCGHRPCKQKGFQLKTPFWAMRTGAISTAFGAMAIRCADMKQTERKGFNGG
jgi:hypothetical protein